MGLTMIFRKKPVVIEAMEYKGDGNSFDIEAWSDGKIIASPVLEPSITNTTGNYLQIQTLEGCMIAEPGDWIIKGINGEFSPCKPDIFEMTYEKVES